jgi:glycosyltransferase involved in cell wall biosynthesis
MVQPLVPKYREPVFAALALTPGIDFEVWADLAPKQGSLKGASSLPGIRCVHAPYSEKGPFLWQPGTFTAVAPPARVVIMPWNSRYVHLVPALVRGRLNGVRTILFGHGIGKRESRTRRAIRNAMLALCDRVILYSPGQAAALVAEGIAAHRVHVAPNSLDDRPIDAAIAAWPAERVDRFLAEHGLRRRGYVVCITRLEAWKRLDLLVAAVARLVEAGRDLSLVLIGDGPERERLERDAARLGIADRVRCPGAIYEEDRLAPWLLGAVCLGFPAGIGLSLLHAFGYGLPVVTSDDRLPHGPEIEALRPGDNGLLFRDGDVAALAEAIDRLASDPVERDRMGAAAAATVRGPNGWNIDAMVAGFREAIAAALAGPATRRGR